MVKYEFASCGWVPKIASSASVKPSPSLSATKVTTRLSMVMPCGCGGTVKVWLGFGWPGESEKPVNLLQRKFVELPPVPVRPKDACPITSLPNCFTGRFVEVIPLANPAVAVNDPP